MYESVETLCTKVTLVLPDASKDPLSLSSFYCYFGNILYFFLFTVMKIIIQEDGTSMPIDHLPNDIGFVVNSFYFFYYYFFTS